MTFAHLAQLYYRVLSAQNTLLRRSCVAIKVEQGYCQYRLSWTKRNLRFKLQATACPINTKSRISLGSISTNCTESLWNVQRLAQKQHVNKKPVPFRHPPVTTESGQLHLAINQASTIPLRLFAIRSCPNAQMMAQALGVTDSSKALAPCHWAQRYIRAAASHQDEKKTNLSSRVDSHIPHR